MMRTARSFTPGFLAGAFWCLLGIFHSFAGYESPVAGGGGIKATLSSIFDASAMPADGSVPFWLEVHNDNDQEEDCFIEFSPDSESDGTLTLSETLPVAAHSTRKFSLVLPIPINKRPSFSFVSIRANFSCRGFSQQFLPISISRGTSTIGQLPALIGDEMNGKVDWTALAKYRQDQSQTPVLESAVNPKDLPVDWKGYDGVGALLLTDHEWLGMDGEQRAAALYYVAIGGRLAIYTDPEVVLSTLNLPLYNLAAGNTPFQTHYAYRFGAGYIGLEDRKDIKSEDINLLFSTLLRTSPVASVDDYTTSWTVGNKVGKVEVNAPLIVTIVVLFATLVGPVNLLYFAPANNRFRLFWTTPLISLSASALLLFGILVADGWGGYGRQFIVVLSLPQLNQEVVMQEQACRTAVLLTTDWKLDDDALVTQIPDTPNDGTRASSDERYSISLPDRDMSGTWFRSRSTPWQYLRTVRPSRSALLLVNADAVRTKHEAPQLLSSFQEEMDEVHLHIGDKYWKALEVIPGQRIVCVEETHADWEIFLTDCREDAGPWNRDVLKEPDVSAAGGTLPDNDQAVFVGTGVSTGKEVVNSLNSIRWQVDKEVYLGAVVEEDKGDSHGH